MPSGTPPGRLEAGLATTANDAAAVPGVFPLEHFSGAGAGSGSALAVAAAAAAAAPLAAGLVSCSAIGASRAGPAAGCFSLAPPPPRRLRGEVGIDQPRAQIAATPLTRSCCSSASARPAIAPGALPPSSVLRTAIAGTHPPAAARSDRAKGFWSVGPGDPPPSFLCRSIGSPLFHCPFSPRAGCLSVSQLILSRPRTRSRRPARGSLARADTRTTTQHSGDSGCRALSAGGAAAVLHENRARWEAAG